MSDTMSDPLPENIRGEKVQKHVYNHEVHHEVPWGQVVLGAGMLALALLVLKWWRSRSSSSDSDDAESDDVLSVDGGEYTVDVTGYGGGLS